MRDLLDYGKAIETLRVRRGLSREELARTSGVSYSYLSEVERGLKRPSTDVLVKLATAMDMLPSDMLRQIEEFSARGRGLLRRRVLEAPMLERPGGASEVEAGHAVGITPANGIGGPELEELVRIASTLDPEDLRILLDLARRLSRPPRR
jgi:transcriptional regulator with XRE-family HTH domain